MADIIARTTRAVLVTDLRKGDGPYIKHPLANYPYWKTSEGRWLQSAADENPIWRQLMKSAQT